MASVVLRVGWNPELQRDQKTGGNFARTSQATYSRDETGASGLSPEDKRALIRQSLDDHYRRVLDRPLPALGGKSSHTAAKIPKGKRR
jgi:hypothetical protein